MPSSAIRTTRRLTHRFGLHRDWWLYVLAMGIGLAMGSLAVLFIRPLQWMEAREAGIAPSTLWIFVLLAPAVGGLLVGVVRSVIRAQYVGPGVTTIIHAVMRRRSRLPLGVGIQKWICATLTIGSGGSAGAEGPIVTIGGTTGSALGQGLGASSSHTSTLLGCGAAAGISAVFNAPIAGVLFVIEILLRDFSVRTFTPIVIASVTASAMTQGILHDSAIFDIGDAFTKHEQPFRIAWSPAWILLGLILGVLAAGFIRLMSVVTSLFERSRVPHLLRPAIGGLLLAGLGAIWLGLFGASHLPDFYGNGYTTITELLSPEHYMHAIPERGVAMLVGIVLLTLACKLVGTCLTIGSGGSGGMFAPSLLMGAATGAILGLGLESMDLLPHGTPARFALVGMAAMVAAVTHAPLTAILIVYELTRNYQIILPLMLAAVVAVAIARLLCSDSVYSAKLRALGIRLGGSADMTVLTRLTVQDLILDPARVIGLKLPVSDVLRQSEDEGASDFVVVDEHGGYVGMVTMDDLQAALLHREAIPLLQVSEICRSDLPTVVPEDTLDTVLERFANAQSDALVVLKDGEDDQITGLVTRARLMRRYQAALDRDRHA
ncbi:MAG: chloride channel protein [Phycisphaerales bacterium]|nr:chloride channel protein [Phycisphaerales bacterium]